MVEKIKEQVMATLKPADVFEYYGIEKKKNKYLCPLHHDTHPSISVKGDLWRCWVCQDKSQNVIDFVMLHEGCNFSDSIKKLCEIAGLDNEKKEAKTKSYSKDVLSIQKDINFCNNAVLFDCNDKEKIFKNLCSLEMQKNNLINTINFENDLERVRLQCENRNNRKCVEMLRKRD